MGYKSRLTGIQRPFVQLIESHSFGLIITKNQDRIDEGGRFTREVANAIEENYPLNEHLGDYIIHRAVQTLSRNLYQPK
jgi:hypothetical protein